MIHTTTNVKRSVTTARAHAKNAAQVTKGRVLAAAGKTTGNRRLQVEGKIDELKGRAMQTSQRLRESLHNGSR
jgi:uncharacterized protein YjbJ (UPF0337 family)